MRYKIFGRRTGLRVSELALGTGNFGTRWGFGAEPADCKPIFDAYLAAGGNFIDTADAYQTGQAEEILGDLIHPERDNLVIASKYSLGTAQAGGIAGTGNSRKTMVRAVEHSLRRLKTDRIDLYWAHMSDGVTPLEEILRGFDDLVSAGKILYGGLSNFQAWRVARGALLADLRGWAPLAAVQVEFNLLERAADREFLPMAESLGLAAALYSPLAAGVLTGKYRSGAAASANSVRSNVRRESSPRDTAILDTLFAIAAETDSTPTHIAVAWLRGRAARSTTALIPILGPRTLGQLEPALGALKIDLTDAQMARLNEASAFELGIPHQMVGHPSTKARVFGNKAELFELGGVTRA